MVYDSITYKLLSTYADMPRVVLCLSKEEPFCYLMFFSCIIMGLWTSLRTIF